MTPVLDASSWRMVVARCVASMAVVIVMARSGVVAPQAGNGGNGEFKTMATGV